MRNESSSKFQISKDLISARKQEKPTCMEKPFHSMLYLNCDTVCCTWTVWICFSRRPPTWLSSPIGWTMAVRLCYLLLWPEQKQGVLNIPGGVMLVRARRLRPMLTANTACKNISLANIMHCTYFKILTWHCYALLTPLNNAACSCKFPHFQLMERFVKPVRVRQSRREANYFKP